jgi:diacylglycerol O-acyltransferase / wax synthase
MEQLSGLDASFLNMETPTMSGHVASMIVFERGDATEGSFEAISDLIRQRLHLFPAFRRRIVEVPLGLDHPFWIEDPDFDLEYHLREVSVPAPGTDVQLGELVARIIGRPLDRRRPLWEGYVINGLEGGRFALLLKIHHCAIDGVSGAELLTVLLDTSPEPRPVEPGSPQAGAGERMPTQVELLVRALGGAATTPYKAMRLQTRLLRTMQSMGQTGRLPFGMGEIGQIPVVGPVAQRLFGPRRDNLDALPAPRPSLLAPRLSFNAGITAHRRFAFRSVPLADAKHVKNEFGTTVNDVVLAMCAGALRTYLHKRDELPDAPLVAMVPVSVRTEDKKGTFGTRVTMLSAPLPVQLSDPVERLRVISDAMKVAKQHNAVGADLLQDFTQFATPALAARAARVAFRARMADWMRPLYNLIVSNVPGPNHPLYLAGAKMSAFYPVSSVADGAGLNITVQSYLGSLDFGLVSCRELVPALWSLVDHLEEALAELVDAARATDH